MKELLIPASSQELRVLFWFDPRRVAILLLGGDKSQDAMWNAWSRVAVPEADRLYDVYVAELHEEGLGHHLRKRPASWDIPAMRAVFSVSHAVSPCRAVDPCVAVSTDAWRTGFVPQDGRCFTDGHGRGRGSGVFGLACGR